MQEKKKKSVYSSGEGIFAHKTRGQFRGREQDGSCHVGIAEHRALDPANFSQIRESQRNSQAPIAVRSNVIANPMAVAQHRVAEGSWSDTLWLYPRGSLPSPQRLDDPSTQDD